CQQSYVTPYSF
nr:immunoglobulin light chain junction region [Macaca mulatta]